VKCLEYVRGRAGFEGVRAQGSGESNDEDDSEDEIVEEVKV
jgi:hypothetical protein